MEFIIQELIPAPPEDVFNAWLDSELHSKMTGGKAQISAELGGQFSAWDGYITGTNLDLVHGSRILQSWRTTDFSPDESDSTLEIEFAPEGPNTRLTIRHSQLPSHGMQYKQGWFDAYLEPMKRFFSSPD